MSATLDTWRKNFSQSVDCFNSGMEIEQNITVEQLDIGFGPRWKISTTGWQFDSIDDMIALLSKAGVVAPDSADDVESFVGHFDIADARDRLKALREKQK